MAGDHSGRFPREHGEAMTAASLFCQRILGRTPDQKPLMSDQADLVASKPPIKDQKHVDQ